MSRIVDAARNTSGLQNALHPARKRRRWLYHSERILFAIGVVCLSLAALLLVIDARLPPSKTAQTDTVPVLVR